MMIGHITTGEWPATSQMVNFVLSVGMQNGLLATALTTQ